MLRYPQEGQSDRDWMQEWSARIGRAPFVDADWQRIETAPQDGSPISVRDGGYAPYLARYVTRPDGSGLWQIEGGVSFIPTHWQPEYVPARSENA